MKTNTKIITGNLSTNPINNLMDEMGETIANVCGFELAPERAKMLIAAYNETYGKGIDPLSLPTLIKENDLLKQRNEELVEALKIAEKFMSDDTTPVYEKLVGINYSDAYKKVHAALSNNK